MLKRVFLLTICSLVSNAYATTGTLLNISNDKADDLGFVTLHFNATPPKIVAEEHGTFIQLKVPNTFVTEPGKFYNSVDPAIAKIAVFQPTETDAAVRLFLTTEAADVLKAAKFETLGKTFVMTIDHKKLIGFAEKKKAEEKANPETAAAVISNTEIDTSIPKPSESLFAETFSQVTKSDDLNEKMQIVAIFSAAMMMLGLLIFMTRHRIRKMARSPEERAIAMETLATLPLAAKQKLSLVKVGDEKILLAVSPDNVSLISNFSMPEQRPALPPARSTGTISSTKKNFEKLMRKTLEERAETPKKTVRAPRPAPARVLEPINLPTVDDEMKNESLQQSTAKQVSKPVDQEPTQRINIAITDDGITDVTAPKAPTKHEAKREEKTPSAQDDITRMIREKLKNLPRIS